METCESKLNPADEASRGLKASELINNATWINGPEFLYEQHEDWSEYHQPSDLTKLLPDDVEVEGIRVNDVCKGYAEHGGKVRILLQLASCKESLCCLPALPSTTRESSNEGKAEQRRTRNPVQPEVHTRFGGRNGVSGAIYRETSSETSL